MSKERRIVVQLKGDATNTEFLYVFIGEMFRYLPLSVVMKHFGDGTIGLAVPSSEYASVRRLLRSDPRVASVHAMDQIFLYSLRRRAQYFTAQ